MDNTSKFMNEALDNSVGTNRSDLGAWKKFSLNLTNVVLPSLIAPELVMVSPMTSFTGYITYLSFVAGSDKGAVKQGDLLNGVFELGKAQKNVNYTSSVVDFNGTVTSGATVTMTVAWTPAKEGSFVIKGKVSNADVLITDVAPATASVARDLVIVTDAVSYARTVNATTGVSEVVFYKADGTIAPIPAADATPSEGNVVGTISSLGLVRANPQNNTTINGVNYQPPVGYANTVAQAQGTLTINANVLDATTSVAITYVYNNEYVPQNDLPLINARMNGIALQAKARRIAVYFSQIAAFQAKTDYGFDLQDQLASKAAGELSYEIDTEIVNFLYEMATKNEDSWGFPVWNRTQPVGVSKAEHYEGFREILDVAGAYIYQQTGGKFMANYIVIAVDLLPILHFLKGFTAAPAGKMNGPFFAGTIDQYKVFVSPALPANHYFVGFNGGEMETSAAVYAPYMPIVPTQVLQMADGGTQQGFATLYDLKALNDKLVIAGRVEGAVFSAFGTTTAVPFVVNNKVITQ